MSGRVGAGLRRRWVSELGKDLSEVEAILVARLERVPTAELNRLRHTLAAQDSTFQVVKNSLCRLVFRDRGWSQLEKLLDGTCGVSPVRGDATAVTKLLVQFARGREGFTLRGGIVEGEFLAPAELTALARLPSRQVLLAQAASGIQAPLSGLVGTLQGVIRQMAGVLHAIMQKQEKQGGKQP